MLLDNKNHGKVITELKKFIGSDSKLSVLSGLFSIYGYSALKKELSSIKGLRLLLSKWDEQSIYTLSGVLSELLLKNGLEQAYIAKECSIWLSIGKLELGRKLE